MLVCDRHILGNTTALTVVYITGIGKIVAMEVADRGGIVHLVCRNQQRGEAAVKEIQEKTNNQVM